MFRSPQVRGSAQATAAPASVVTRLPDWVYRTIYYYGFRAARLVWRFTKPRHFGALVMLWHDKRVLLVRTSYQDGWVAPGGGIKADEAPVQAAIREASEELGLQLTLEDLRHALAVEHFWDNRRDKVQIFELEVSDAPKIRIDNREIIEARFVTLEEALSLHLAPHLHDYFQMTAARLKTGGRQLGTARVKRQSSRDVERH